MEWFIDRKAEFSASHYYDNPAMSPRRISASSENAITPTDTATTTTLEVTVKGNVDPRSGFVVDLKQLQRCNERGSARCNGPSFSNKEVPEFSTRIPTTENLAIAIWERLAPKLKAAQLHRVRVYETPDLFVDVYGEP